VQDIELIKETALDIRDRFGLDKTPDDMVDERQQYEALKKLLSHRIEEMIDHEFDRFVNLLYRIDVNEAKVREALSEQPFSKGVEKVADMIIQRQLQKVATRRQYSSSRHDLEFDI
jgi:hypothetical protein